MSFDQAIARQAELSLGIAKAVVNVKKVDSENFSHAILTTRINSLKKNEFTENHRHLCTLRSTENFLHEYFKTNLYYKTEEEYLLAISYHYLCSLSLPPPAALPGTIAPTGRQLPRMNLPQFSGKFTDWGEFRDLFVSMVMLRHRFRFPIDLILVRELTLYTLSRSTPYIVILVFGVTRRKFTKDEAREKEIICFNTIKSWVRFGCNLNHRILHRKLF